MDGGNEFEKAFARFISGRLTYPKLVSAIKSTLAEKPELAAVYHQKIQDMVNIGRFPADLAAGLSSLVEMPVPTRPAPHAVRAFGGMPPPQAAPAMEFEDDRTVPFQRPEPVIQGQAGVTALGGPPKTGPHHAFDDDRNVSQAPLYGRAGAPGGTVPAPQGYVQAPGGGVFPPPNTAPLPPHPRIPVLEGGEAQEPTGLGGANTKIRGKVDEVLLNNLIDDFRDYRKTKGQVEATNPHDRDRRELDGLLSDFRGARFRRDAKLAEAGQPREREYMFVGRAPKRPGVGSLLKDRFVLDRELGRGGMGVVYAAVDRRRLEAVHTQPYVAVKLLNEAFERDQEILRALEAESRKAQALAHPNIVTVFDFDRDGQYVFIVMELLQGQSLADLIAERPDRKLRYDEAQPVIDGICRALHHAHVLDVVHADLKPGNVFITNDGQVKLLDFGIASAGRLPGFDATELNAYTAPYASPEMIEGAPRDPRDDIYALGILIYSMLTGGHPYDRVPGNEARDRNMRPRPIPGVGRREWKMLESTLSFSRGVRPINALQIYQNLYAPGFWQRMFQPSWETDEETGYRGRVHGQS